MSDMDDPYDHLHIENYADEFATGRVDAQSLVTMAGRACQSLDGEWDFVLDLYDEGLRQKWYANDLMPIGQWTIPRDYDGGEWQQVPVPSCWNMLKPEWFYFEGSGWYGRTLTISPAIFSAASSLRSRTATLAPWAASALAMLAHNTPAPPVKTAALPRRLTLISTATPLFFWRYWTGCKYLLIFLRALMIWVLMHLRSSAWFCATSASYIARCSSTPAMFSSRVWRR